MKLLPETTYKDIINHLVFKPSPFTADDMMAFRGLEAYNQFVNGWVSNVLWMKINSVILIKAKVIIRFQ